MDHRYPVLYAMILCMIINHMLKIQVTLSIYIIRRMINMCCLYSFCKSEDLMDANLKTQQQQKNKIEKENHSLKEQKEWLYGMKLNCQKKKKTS